MLSALALCRKAGQLIIGYELTAEAALKKSVLVVFASDISERTYRNVLRLKENGTTVLSLGETMDDIEAVVGKRFGVAGITDSGLAELVERKISVNRGGETCL